MRASTIGMLLTGFVGLVLTLKVFRGIISGEMVLLQWTFKRDENERSFWIWMGIFVLACFALYLVALRFYFGPFGL